MKLHPLATHAFVAGLVLGFAGLLTLGAASCLHESLPSFEHVYGDLEPHTASLQAHTAQASAGGIDERIASALADQEAMMGLIGMIEGLAIVWMVLAIAAIVFVVVVHGSVLFGGKVDAAACPPNRKARKAGDA